MQKHRHQTKRVSVVTLGEFAVGAPVAYTLKFFRGYQPVALGAATAIYAGRLQASLPFEMGENDLWIAATALRMGWPVVTRDKAFARFSGIKVNRLLICRLPFHSARDGSYPFFSDRCFLRGLCG